MKPDSGRVTIDCEDNGRSIGLCPQPHCHLGKLNRLEQIVFMGQMYNMSVTEVKRKGEDLLESLGLLSIKEGLQKNCPAVCSVGLT